MELECSLPHSQMPATCPYPEPTRSSPYTTSYFLKINLNIILPSMSGSPKWSLSLRCPHQSTVYACPLPHTRYMPRPSHSSPFYHPNNIGWAVQIIQLLIMQFSPLPCYPVPLRPKYSPQHPVLKHHQPAFIPQCQRPSYHIATQCYEKQGMAVFLHCTMIIHVMGKVQMCTRVV